MITILDFTHFFNGQKLNPYGSNFTKWYLHLRTSLQHTETLFTIIEPLGLPPEEHSDQAMINTFSYRWNYYFIVRTAINNMMVPEMRSFWETAISDEIICDLKEIFAPEVRLMGYECLNEFLSCKMEEHGCAGLHLAKMLRIHRRLNVEFGFDLTDDIAKSVVLRSLPPSYKSFVKRFLRKVEPVNFHQLMARIRLHDIKPSHMEIIDLIGICDIQCYKCFINT
jgi:hypothetical protein